MTDDKAVEAVAQAIYNEEFQPASGDMPDIELLRNQARAAIAAYKAHLEAEGMVVVPREPTEGMVAAAVELPLTKKTGRATAPMKAVARWQAMIDHIKQE